MFQLSKASITQRGRKISDPLVSPLRQRSCSLKPSEAPKLTPVKQEQWVSLPLTWNNYSVHLNTISPVC